MPTAKLPRRGPSDRQTADSEPRLTDVEVRKSETHFTTTTMYADIFVSRDVFHWESQSAASRGSSAGKRYLDRSSTELVFVRINREDPFVALGPVELIDATGDRPIAINR